MSNRISKTEYVSYGRDCRGRLVRKGDMVRVYIGNHEFDDMVDSIGIRDNEVFIWLTESAYRVTELQIKLLSDTQAERREK